MIRPSLFFSLLSLLPFGCLAQINVQGRVMDMNDCEPLAGASIVIKGSDGKIKKFTSTKADGDFFNRNGIGRRMSSGDNDDEF